MWPSAPSRRQALLPDLVFPFEIGESHLNLDVPPLATRSKVIPMVACRLPKEGLAFDFVQE